MTDATVKLTLKYLISQELQQALALAGEPSHQDRSVDIDVPIAELLAAGCTIGEDGLPVRGWSHGSCDAIAMAWPRRGSGAPAVPEAHLLAAGSDGRLAYADPFDRILGAEEGLVAWRAGLAACVAWSALAAAAEREAAEREAREAAEREAREAAAREVRKAAERADREAIDAYLSVAAPELVAQHREGLLSVWEITTRARSDLFAAIDLVAEPLVPLRDEDLRPTPRGGVGDECDEAGHDARYHAEDHDDPVSPAAYAVLVGIRGAAPDGAEVDIRRHLGWCRRDDCSATAHRLAVRVRLAWHGLTLSAEYGLPG